MVIPDCFNLEVPLPGYVPLHIRKQAGSHDATPTPECPVTSSANPEEDDDSDVEMLLLPESITVQQQQQPSGENPLPNDLPSGSLGSIPKPKPVIQPPPTSPLTSPSAPRRASSNFTPGRMTLKNVKDARILHPVTIATGLMNTLTDIVQDRVFLVSKPSVPEGTSPATQEEDSDTEETYEVL